MMLEAGSPKQLREKLESSKKLNTVLITIIFICLIVQAGLESFPDKTIFYLGKIPYLVYRVLALLILVHITF